MSARPNLAKSFSMRVLLALARHTPSSQYPTQQGLSLIECLIAIIVIALTATAITPPILLATGTRIQSRRAEQANQIAQAEVDRIRSVVERGLYTTADLPINTGQKTGIASFGPPTNIGPTLLTSRNDCPSTRYPQTKTGTATELVKVDIDGDCQAEYLMQVFRTDGCVPNNGDPNQPYSFYVGVRIYSYKDGETINFDPDTQRATFNLSSTGRKDQVNGLRKPLQTLYTKISRSNSQQSYECVAQ